MVSTVEPERTAARDRASFAPVVTFLAVRRARTVLIGAVVYGVLAAVEGTYQASLPSASGGQSSLVPLWRMLAMGVATLPVLGMHSQLASLEVVATRRLRRLQRIYLAGGGVGAALIYLGIAALTLPASALAIAARSLLAWYGLALLSGVVLGWRLAWTLPALAAVILWYWGYQDGQYFWWEFSARPYHDPRTALLSVALLGAGMAGYWLTPWRRAAVTRLGRLGR